MSSLTRHVIFERDEHGSPYAAEIVDAEGWDNALFDPPTPEQADVRFVRLTGATPPPNLPRWLRVEVIGRRAAEAPARYTAATETGRALWPWSPYYRGPGPGLAEFLSAGAAALSHPDPTPAEADRQLALIAAFARGRASPLAQVETLRSDALERWLRYAFVDADRFVDALLLERLRDEAPEELYQSLRFLAEAEVPPDDPHSELAVDRSVLREQASLWRYFDGAPFTGPLHAVQAWQRRYRLAYDAHYRAVIRSAQQLRHALDAVRPAASALEHMDGVRALGAPAGGEALASYAAAKAALAALPADPDPQAARTAGVTLGREPAAFAQGRMAVEAVQQALEVQRQRLASGTVRMVLERPGVPALDQLLQAIAASDVDGIERVLDERLVAHIERLLTEAVESPLSELAARYPIVTTATLDDATAAFRELLETAITVSEGNRAVLREDRAAVVG